MNAASTCEWYSINRTKDFVTKIYNKKSVLTNCTAQSNNISLNFMIGQDPKKDVLLE